MFAKPKKNPTEQPAGWLSLSEMHAVFGLTPQGFAKSVRPLLPAEAVKSAGERGAVRIHARSAVDAWCAKQVEKAVKDLDPLLSGSDSPALEEYRRHRAALAELDLLERRKELVPLAKLWPTLERLAALIRRGGESLQRRFGDDAAAVHNDAIASALLVLKDEKGGEAK